MSATVVAENIPLASFESAELRRFNDDGSLAPELTTVSSLWSEKPLLLLLIRRPGCSLCREEALEYVAVRELIEVNMGVRMVAVVHEQLGADEFNKNFWKGELYFDEKKALYTALGEGKLRSQGLLGLLSPSVWKNLARAHQKGVQGNIAGNGLILGGLLVISKSSDKVVYQYKEKIFGDHAPREEVLAALSKLTGVAFDNAALPAERLTEEKKAEIAASCDGDACDFTPKPKAEETSQLPVKA